jgi:putative RNA 2'-phosphotransferase
MVAVEWPAMSEEISKRLSYVLRHRPDSIGIVLDEAGWTDVGQLLEALARRGLALSRDELARVVATNDKKRFAFSADGNSIRAVQGHSVEVNLAHPVLQPPELLYHGTVERFLAAILREGLKPGKRHDVHLSPDPDTARRASSAAAAALLSSSPCLPAPCTSTVSSSAAPTMASGWRPKCRRGICGNSATGYRVSG